jgi:CubicO group peptidase (beta-lactamase class C family)
VVPIGVQSPYVEDPRLDRITARLVFSHSSGFPNWRPGRWSNDPKPLLIEFDPGERFQYSGEGYVYLQRVVEHLTGETLDRYLERAVFEPLGMTDSSFLWEKRFEDNHASPHDGEGAPGRKWRPREAAAFGTLHTTASDYARFLQALVADDPDSPKPLSSTSIERMLTPHSSIDNFLGWSLGWGTERRDNDILFWQWGDNGDVKALSTGSRSTGTAVVVLTNGRWGLDVSRAIMELVLGKGRFFDFRFVQYRP